MVSQKEIIEFKLQKVKNRTIGKPQLISYIIHQTNEHDTLPADMVMAIDTIIEKNPEYSYRYYNGTERRDFLVKHMSAVVVAAYDKLIPRAFKADLFRYSAVYVEGGCYMDISFIFVDHLRYSIHPNDTFISTPDGYFPDFDLNSAFFCASVRHPILLATIH
jgi:mannosyltransferase OCH1-like enzyme